MLNKLFKYDFKYMTKNMCVFYILSIVFAILTRIFFSLKQTVVIDIISQICVGAMFSMIASILINTMMRSWVRFKESIYGDEAYLTHTLPVSKCNIFESKFVLTILFLLISFIVVIISLFIAYYTKDRWDIIINFINSISTNLSIPTIPFIICIFIILFLEILNGIQSGYIGMVIGHKYNNSKIGLSVLFGFVSYMISQTIVLIILFIIGLFDNDILLLFKGNDISNLSLLKTLIYTSIGTYIFVILLSNYISIKLLNKGVNIE